MDLQTLAALKSLADSQPTQGRVHLQLESVCNKLTRDGKPFLEMQLLDATAQLTLRVWSDHPDYATHSALEAGGFHELTGEFFRNGNFGVDVRKYHLRRLADDECETLLAGPPELREKQNADYAEIQRLVESLTDPRLLAICRLFLEELGARFRRSAGARFVHHARRGGLVEHTAQMMRSADAIQVIYPYLNRDLLLAGALLHDIGKLWENHVPENGFSISLDERGELLGHITIGAELVNSLWRKLQPQMEAWQTLEPATEQVRLHLLHLVASHHGTHEFGSPVLPKTPEALALNVIDNLDAKLEIFAQGYKTLPLLTPHIHEKVRPLNHHLIRPLAACPPPVAEEEDQPGASLEA
ncbi:MAG TPA: HD domain-containing protein [Chthoniobacterales bacterium]